MPGHHKLWQIGTQNNMDEYKTINQVMYSVSYEDLVDMWIESLHPLDHVIVIWDALNHIKLLKNAGFIVDEVRCYNNKILTISVEDVRHCFYIMDVISTYERHPFVQIYSKGRKLTDNMENLRMDLTN